MEESGQQSESNPPEPTGPYPDPEQWMDDYAATQKMVREHTGTARISESVFETYFQKLAETIHRLHDQNNQEAEQDGAADR